jgi:uncharacterized protein YdgA (DUF945 family)
MTDVITSTLSSVIVNTGYLNALNLSTTNVRAANFYGDGTNISNVPSSWVGTATSDLNMGTYNISNATEIHTANFYGDGTNISNVPSSWVGTATSDLNMGTYNISNASEIHVANFYGDGTNISNVPSSWVSTATSDLNMATYSISNVSSIYNQSGQNLSININKDETDVSLFINMNGISFSITANGTTGAISFTNANSSNLTLNLGGNTGTLSVGNDTNLYWNNSLIWTDANQAH